MSVQTMTNPTTGRRVYFIEPRDRWMYSVTTGLKTASKEALIYAAGKLGMDTTLAMAHEVAKGVARGPWSVEDFEKGGIPASFEDFEYRVIEAMNARLGTVKSTGRPVPPHVALWGQKADDGTTVHLMVERRAKERLGIFPPHIPEERITPDVRAAFERFLSWEEDYCVEYIASESVVWLSDEDGWFDVAARIDLACIVDGEELILDVKTGKMDRGNVPYVEQRVQVRMQALAANIRELSVDHSFSGGILHVPVEAPKVRGKQPEVTLHRVPGQGFREDMAYMRRRIEDAVYLWGPPETAAKKDAEE